MYELILTIVILFPNHTATVTQYVLLKLNSKEDCMNMKVQVAQQLISDPIKVPSHLDCRIARYDNN